MAFAARLGSCLATLALVAVAASGCGKKGPPLPPLPRGPLPARGVEVRQLGGRVLVALDAPEARGARPAQQPVEVELVRVAYPPGLRPPLDPDSFRRRGESVARVALDPQTTSASRLSVEDSTLDALSDRGIGWTLRYAVRVTDRHGRPSPLVLADDLVPLAPAAAPTGLSAEPTADGMRLVWGAPSGAGNARYNVYRAPAGAELPEAPLNQQPLETSEFLDTAAHTGQRYRYAVRVALAAEPPFREGAPSEAVEVLAEDRFPPAAPTGLVAVQEGLAVRLFWDPNRERDVAGYRLERRSGSGAWEPVGPDPIRDSLFLDEAVAVGQRLGYRVRAVDRADPPNASPSSTEVELVVVAEPVAPGSEDR